MSQYIVFEWGTELQINEALFQRSSSEPIKSLQRWSATKNSNTISSIPATPGYFTLSLLSVIFPDTEKLQSLIIFILIFNKTTW